MSFADDDSLFKSKDLNWVILLSGKLDASKFAVIKCEEHSLMLKLSKVLKKVRFFLYVDTIFNGFRPFIDRDQDHDFVLTVLIELNLCQVSVHTLVLLIHQMDLAVRAIVHL